MGQSYSQQKNIKGNRRWRREVVRQLRSLDIEYWPGIFINILNRSNKNEYDILFQKELYWIDSEIFAQDEKIIDSELNIQHKIESYFSDNDDDSCKSLHPNSAGVVNKYSENYFEITIDQDVRTNFSGSPKPKTKKVAKTRIFDTIESLNKSSDNSRQLKKKKKLLKNQDFFSGKLRFSEWKIESRNSQKNQGSFKLNMLTNHLLLMNGLDSRSINNISDLYEAVKKYKAITNLIESHVNQKEHVFNQLITQFEAYFVSHYGNIGKRIEEYKLTLQDCEILSNKATLDLQQFIIIFSESLDRFYAFSSLKSTKGSEQENLLNRNNMINFVTSILFRPKIHEVIFDLYRVLDKEKEEVYQINLKHCFHYHPEDFGVSDKYCLNRRTLKQFAILSCREDKSTKSTQNDFEENQKDREETSLQSEKTPELRPSEKRNGSDKSPSKLNLNSNSDNEKQKSEAFIPYEKAINAIANLKNKLTPLQKLKTIIKVSELIDESIENFNRKWKINQKEELNGDEIFPIFIYIITKSQINHLMTHCRIIEKFSTNNVLSSMAGYYAITLEACVNYICTLSFENEIEIQ